MNLGGTIMISVFTHFTDLSFKDAFDRLSTLLQEEKFNVLCSIPLSEKFKDKGIAFDEQLTICEVCNPFEANKVISLHEQAMFFLPCKIIIRTKNQKTMLEMALPTSLVAPFNHVELTQLAQSIEDTLIEAIKRV
jgi:uncharacterized protein (DUF302 family)